VILNGGGKYLHAAARPHPSTASHPSRALR
jgi:hypothetical protein